MFAHEKEKQLEILASASAVFASKDYHQVTMDEIAKAADVGKGTLYRYYKNKEDLYTHILAEGLKALYSYLTHEVGKEADFLRKIERLIYCSLNFFDQNKPFVKVFLKEEVRMREQMGHPCIAVLEKITRFIEALLREGKENGHVKSLDIALLASSLIGMVKACFLSELESLVKLSLTERARILTEIFLKGAQSKPNEVRSGV